MKKLAKKEIGIGLSVIVAILILIFGIEFLKGINLFRPAHFYMAYYDNVDGLEVSAPVKVNGYKVGQVREINFNYAHPGKTEILLAVNKNLLLPEGSVAVIRSSLMGEAYIEIEVGKSNEKIAEGGVVETKQGGGLLDGVTGDVMPKVTNTLETVDILLSNLNSVITDPALKNSIGKLEGISDNVYFASKGLNSLLNQDVPAIMRNANGIVGNVDGIVGSVGKTMVKIDTVSGNLALFSRELKDLPLTQTMESVNRTLEGVNQTVMNLEAFSNQLKNPNSTLGMLMNDPELYNRLNSVAASVDSLIVDIKRNPKRYISIKLL